jgi:hypothetical protein
MASVMHQILYSYDRKLLNNNIIISNAALPINSLVVRMSICQQLPNTLLLLNSSLTRRAAQALDFIPLRPQFAFQILEVLCIVIGEPGQKGFHEGFNGRQIILHSSSTTAEKVHSRDGEANLCLVSWPETESLWVLPLHGGRKQWPPCVHRCTCSSMFPGYNFRH